MPRVSFTAFEAEWLLAVVSTCGEIAEDTLPHVAKQPPRRTAENSSAAWDRIVDKINKGLVE